MSNQDERVDVHAPGESPDLFPGVTTPWQEPEDLLERAPHAEFLTSVLRNKKEPFVLNLNASWGHGKTFFIQHWAKGILKSHPVVYVNAWETDFSDDPLVSVISAFDEQLIRPYSSLVQKFRKQLLESGGHFFKETFKEILPQIVRSIVKKHLGQEAMDALEGTGQTELDENDVLADTMENATKTLLSAHKQQEQSREPRIIRVSELFRHG